eukprot:GHVN01033993.1.p1 GENE.GHVN01033993.1~~GHVN01033993.1.p1  ORF type:complete len:211 (-),score=23.38 GHVN01033993.1:167-799(-)
MDEFDTEGFDFPQNQSDGSGSPKSIGASPDPFAPTIGSPGLVDAPALGSPDHFAPSPLDTGSPLPAGSPLGGSPIGGSPVGGSPGGSPGGKPKTALRVWEEKHEVELEQKQLEENKQKKILREKAAEQIRAFYSEREQKIKKTKASNQMEEQVGLRANQESFDNRQKQEGVSWERVCSLIDFNKEERDGHRDTSRMKQLLFQLKQSQEAN